MVSSLPKALCQDTLFNRPPTRIKTPRLKPTGARRSVSLRLPPIRGKKKPAVPFKQQAPSRDSLYA